MSTAKYVILYCLEGLSDTLCDELRWHGFEVIFQDCASALVQIDSIDAIYYLNAHIRVATHIDWLLYEDRSCSQVSAAYRDIEAMAFRWLFTAGQSFAVRAERHGTHEFGSMDLMREVAAAITMAMNRHGQTLRANLKDPDLYFRVYLRDERLVLSLNTNGEVLSKRHSYPFHHAAQLNRTIAAAMIWQSNFFRSGRLVDPMCGGGSLLYEAAHWQQNRPIARLDWPFAFRRHPYFQEEAWQRQWHRQIDYQIPPGQLIGADIDQEKLSGTLANFQAAGLTSQLELHLADARTMPYLSDSAIDELLCNPPYGIRVLRPREVDRLYRDFAACCASKNIERILAITTKKHSWLRAFDSSNYDPASVKPVNYSNMPASIFDMKRRPDEL